MPLGDHTPDLVQSPRPLETLEAEITTLAAHLSAATYRLLELIAEFDRRHGWSGIGLKSCAHWLSWKCGIGLVAAREKVRIARALDALPGIADAMRRGELSYSKVRAMTRIATASNEQTLLAIALNGTATQVERTAQLYRRTSRALERDVATAQHRDRELSYYFDEDGTFVIHGRLTAEQGAVIVKALQTADSALRADAASKGASVEATALGSKRGDWRAQQADAFALLAETMLAHGAEGAASNERHLVHVHVNVEALSGTRAEDVQCHVHEGPALARDVARKVACDASLVGYLEDNEGNVLDLGRKTRAIPVALRRALEHRDEGCRFPGCLSTRFVDAHHIEHWVDGGETRIDNLVLLCRYHHGLVHEGGFALESARGELVFRRQDGRVIAPVPQAVALHGCGGEALQRAHSASGLRIDERTAVSGWFGERADYDYLIALIDERDRPNARFSGSAAATAINETDRNG
jgi:hypothetical protein